MYCGKCGSEIIGNAKFCSKCGGRIAERNVSEKVISTKAGYNGKVSSKALIAHGIAWLVLGINIFTIMLEEREHFVSVINTYRDDFNIYTILFYLIFVAVVVVALMSIVAIVNPKEEIIRGGMQGSFAFGILFVMMALIERELSGSGSVKKLLLRMITGVYTTDMWEISWVCLAIAFVVAIFNLRKVKK